VKVLLLTPPEPEPHESCTFQEINSLLKQLGHAVVEHKADAALFENVQVGKPDVVFNLASLTACEKTNFIPAVLEIAGVRYTGSGFLSLSLACNATRLFPLLYQSGIPMPPFRITKVGDIDQRARRTYPLDLFLAGSRQKLTLRDARELGIAVQAFPSQKAVVLQQHLAGDVISLYLLDTISFLSAGSAACLPFADQIRQLIEARGLVRFDFILAGEPFLVGLDVSPDPLGDEFLALAAQSGWSAMDVVRTVLEHAATDRQPSSQLLETTIPGV
jgi:hypothetical protein